MSASIAFGRSLRLVSRNLYKAQQHSPRRPGLCAQRRHYSELLLDQLFRAAPSTNGAEKPRGSPHIEVGYEGYGHGRWETNPSDPTDPIRFRRREDSAPVVALRSWLRDSCLCSKCVDPSSGQKRFASVDVPDQLPIVSLSAETTGALCIRWADDFLTRDTHRSIYPLGFWMRPGQPSKRKQSGQKPWTREILEQVSPYYSYESFMQDGPEYRAAMTALGDYGIIFLRGLPSSEETVKELAPRMGHIQETFYGVTWDVVSKPEAENVAYTNTFLGLHQDLLYLRNVPQIQILHCLKNSCSGGESLFSDSYHAAREFRRRFPEMIEPLTSRMVSYGYNKNGNKHWQSHPVLWDQGINWSPPFQTPFKSDELTTEGMHKYSRWLEAARALRGIFEDESNVYEYKMQPGECVIFNNHKLLHGRRAFDTSSGERWLKGTYVDASSFRSKLKTLMNPAASNAPGTFGLDINLPDDYDSEPRDIKEPWPRERDEEFLS
ncbi:putative gamma-butyrobetaine dioxygenase [Rosellinia necatrix]|uniref:Putative gamma-butyrobetaine dioxygenase n=1 Tax=Rosellinia necatrix TaxID=77044 RepID=A0A1W2THH0_ROSNE|nr:putative gamma-butyrobetaine dioxygenase [Rosellinia necatrix]